MTALWIIVGIAIGAGGYYLYDRFFTSTYKVGAELLARAKGDVAAARAHIAKL